MDIHKHFVISTTEKKKLRMCVNPVVFSYKKVKHSQEQDTLPSSCPFNMPLILPRRNCH